MTGTGRKPLRTAGHQGAAILTALLLMALVATLSTAALWQQARAYDLEASERARVQANWILHGTTDWARLILREDARSGAVDHLGEPGPSHCRKPSSAPSSPMAPWAMSR